MSDRAAKARPAASSRPPSAPGHARWRTLIADTVLGGRLALVIPIACAAFFLAFPVFANDAYWIREFSLIAVLALVISGVNLSFGYAGEIQFGQLFMFALGAYLTMILAGRVIDEIVPLLLIGGAAAAIVGAVIAVPAVRIGGWSLALTSFFLIITIPDLVSIFEKYTGGLVGLIDIPIPKLGGGELSTNGLYEVTILATVVWFAIYRNLVTSRYGIIFRILRESPVVANSLGFSTRALKVMAYTMGAFPAGVAGCLYGFITLVVTPASFDLSLAIGIVAGSLLGGVESIYGVFIAAALLQLGPESSVSFAQYAPVVYGAFLIVAAILFRDGLSGLGKTVALRASRILVGEAEAAHTAAVGSLSAHVANEGDADSAALVTPDELTIDPLDGRALTVASVSKSFGGNKALDDVSLAAEPGRVTALIGANGSGKTTMLNLICGYERADAGTIALGDVALTDRSPHQVARVGVGRTFQTPSVPRGVSVLDVVASGRFVVDRCGPFASILRLPRYWKSRRADRDDALALLGLVGLVDLAEQEASSLSLGTRRLVEVARALCSKPGLLLLDEPASGLSDDEVERLGRVLIAAAQAGATVVLIEHNFAFVSAICEQAHVLEFGKLIASGPPARVAADPLVIESFLGQAPDAAAVEQIPGVSETEDMALESGASAIFSDRDLSRFVRHGTNGGTGGPLLEVRDVVSGYGDLQVLRGVSLTLPRDGLEVVLGRNGVGKTTLLNAITGQLRLWEGSIKLEGRELRRIRSYRRAAAGIALVQEGKRIFRQRTIAENVALGTFSQALSRRERRNLCESILDGFPMLAERADEPAGALSGGQQQMLAIAQALASRPRLLLLDEPSAGLAPAIVRELFQRIKQLCDDGMTILLVEQLAQQALLIADHVTVLDNGRVVASGPPEQFHDQRGLQAAYFGDSVAAIGQRETMKQL